MEQKDIILTGCAVRLEPLRQEHARDLFQISQDQELWRYTPYNPSHSLIHMQDWINTSLQAREQGTEFPFVIIDLHSEQVIGSTRFRDISVQHRNLEIGSTWIMPAAQRRGINMDAKFTMLVYAFEDLRMIRVFFKTHPHNTKSQGTLEKLGAVKEGYLRNHLIMPDGSYRDSICYSIIDREWPEVKAKILQTLAQYTSLRN